WQCAHDAAPRIRRCRDGTALDLTSCCPPNPPCRPDASTAQPVGEAVCPTMRLRLVAPARFGSPGRHRARTCGACAPPVPGPARVKDTPPCAGHRELPATTARADPR